MTKRRKRVWQLLLLLLLGAALGLGMAHHEVYRSDGEVTTSGTRRGYLLHVPKSYQPGKPAPLVISFHGLPRRSLDLGDPYHCECMKTGRLLAESLNLAPDQVRICFQSRFGRAEWLQPYTAPTLAELGRAGTGRVDVICPGFVADCLETLEEIALEGKAEFLGAGGKEYHYIPALNEENGWISAVTAIVERHIQGWPTTPADPAALARSAELAKARGATT